MSTPARWQLAAGRWPAWLLAAALAGCGEGSRTLTFTGPVMGTGYRVVAVGVRPAIEEKALESDVVSDMEQVNRQMSTYLPGSDMGTSEQDIRDMLGNLGIRVPRRALRGQESGWYTSLTVIAATRMAVFQRLNAR